MRKCVELKYTELMNYCSLDELNFCDTNELNPLYEIIGQEKALNIFNLGINTKMNGYNIYIAGSSGMGKTTYAEMKTKEFAKKQKVPDDWCYVYNFNNCENPIALNLEAGKGIEFKEDINELVQLFSMKVKEFFNSIDYEKQKNILFDIYLDKKEKFLKEISEIVKEYNFDFEFSDSEIYFLPLIDGKILSEEEYENLDSNKRNEINQLSLNLQKKAFFIVKEIKELDIQLKKELDIFDYKIGMFILGYHMNYLKEKYQNYEKILNYLNQLQEDLLDNINEFKENFDNENNSVVEKKISEDIKFKYNVNVIVDNSKLEGAPVFLVFNPTYYDLMGEIEYSTEFGNLTTDFMKIKSGILHKANGGYLIIQAQDLFSNIQSWELIRRVIIDKKIKIENFREQVTVPLLKPETIPISLKVIIVGSNYYYDLLNYYYDDFNKLFKIKIEFDYEMNRNNNNIYKIAEFIKSFSKIQNTQPFDKSAISKIIEYSSRLVGKKDKLTTRFGIINDILCEATTWANIENSDLITSYHINKAIFEREKRFKFYEESLSDMINNNIIMIDTEGKKIGQINALVVLDMNDYIFGSPTRITVTTYLGKAGIINIEKEVGMSGQTHNKGIQIIIGYLGQNYAQEFPLSLSCRICFEQNYNGIDGDSASSAELYCILSNLSELPINQEIAVTGSINQRGEIQAIGGVTQKIEGFFDICKKRGLTGNQGVIIPAININELVLNDDVIESIKEGIFHIYPIYNIDEGIEIVMNKSAIEVHKKVKEKLEMYYKKSIINNLCE